jgi:hypothetical protein
VSTSFVLSLFIVVALVLGARFLISALPSRRHARPITVTDALLAAVGVAGLALHCGSMFFRAVVDALPGTGAAISEINSLGTASIVWYAVPALLVVLGLRRQHPAALAAVALALSAVGVTMYDAGSLSTHLTAIFVSVVVLAAVASTLVLPPWRSRPALS